MIGSKVFKVFIIIIIIILSSFFILFEKEINFSGGLLREETEAEELSNLASAVFGGEGEGEVVVEADLIVAVIVVVGGTDNGPGANLNLIAAARVALCTKNNVTAAPLPPPSLTYLS
jgi:hypothetical protein